MIQETRGPTNLFAWNKSISDTSWTKVQCTVPSENSSSPNGSLSAAILHENTANAAHGITAIPYLKYGMAYCQSVYVKAIGRTWIRLINRTSLPAAYYNNWFDVLNGVAGTIDATTVTYGIIPCSNSWFRCYISYVSTTIDGFFDIPIRIATANNIATYVGTDIDSLYIWRPMWNKGYYPDDYSKAETMEVPVS